MAADIFVEKKGMNPYAGPYEGDAYIRILPAACALCTTVGSSYSLLVPRTYYRYCRSGSTRLGRPISFSTIVDMFPNRAIATTWITGIGGMAGVWAPIS